MLSPLTRRGSLLLLVVLALLVAACSGGTAAEDLSSDPGVGSEAPEADTSPTDAVADDAGPLRVGGIPDQDPEVLARKFGVVADVLGEALGVEVTYAPVAEYNAAVSLFSTGDLDLVWFGGLTGVQARLRTPDSVLLAQRDIDEEFRSVFIANVDAGVEPIADVDGLDVLADTRLTFGSESSTSGRLMPQFFLGEAGVGPDDLDGEPGFSGSHDATIDLVEAGSFQVGALNEQVWRSRVEAGTVDTDRVVELFVTPTYNDYQWVAGPDLDDRFGEGFTDRITEVLLGLSPDVPAEAEVLELFGAGAFVPAVPADYDRIETIGRALGLIVE